MPDVLASFERPVLPGQVGQTGPVFFKIRVSESYSADGTPHGIRMEYLYAGGVVSGADHRAVCEVALSEPRETDAWDNLYDSWVDAILVGQQSLPAQFQVDALEASAAVSSWLYEAQNPDEHDGGLVDVCKRV